MSSPVNGGVEVPLQLQNSQFAGHRTVSVDRIHRAISAVVHIGFDTWQGSGFLVDGRTLMPTQANVPRFIIMSNEHVLKSPSAARTAVVSFHKFDENGRPSSKQYSIGLAPDRLFECNSDLDYAICAVAIEADQILVDRGEQPLPLNERPTMFKGMTICVVQHPGGQPKQASSCSLEEIPQVPASPSPSSKEIADAAQISYLLDTEPGSSGSPVFNGDWDVIGIHYAGGSQRNFGHLLLPMLSDVRRKWGDHSFAPFRLPAPSPTALAERDKLAAVAAANAADPTFVQVSPNDRQAIILTISDNFVFTGTTWRYNPSQLDELIRAAGGLSVAIALIRHMYADAQKVADVQALIVRIGKLKETEPTWYTFEEATQEQRTQILQYIQHEGRPLISSESWTYRQTQLESIIQLAGGDFSVALSILKHLRRAGESFTDLDSLAIRVKKVMRHGPSEWKTFNLYSPTQEECEEVYAWVLKHGALLKCTRVTNSRAQQCDLLVAGGGLSNTLAILKKLYLAQTKVDDFAGLIPVVLAAPKPASGSGGSGGGKDQPAGSGMDGGGHRSSHEPNHTQHVAMSKLDRDAVLEILRSTASRLFKDATIPAYLSADVEYLFEAAGSKLGVLSAILKNLFHFRKLEKSPASDWPALVAKVAQCFQAGTFNFYTEPEAEDRKAILDYLSGDGDGSPLLPGKWKYFAHDLDGLLHTCDGNRQDALSVLRNMRAQGENYPGFPELEARMRQVIQHHPEWKRYDGFDPTEADRAALIPFLSANYVFSTETFNHRPSTLNDVLRAAGSMDNAKSIITKLKSDGKKYADLTALAAAVRLKHAMASSSNSSLNEKPAPTTKRDTKDTNPAAASSSSVQLTTAPSSKSHSPRGPVSSTTRAGSSTPRDSSTSMAIADVQQQLRQLSTRVDEVLESSKRYQADRAAAADSIKHRDALVAQLRSAADEKRSMDDALVRIQRMETDLRADHARVQRSLADAMSQSQQHHSRSTVDDESARQLNHLRANLAQQESRLNHQLQQAEQAVRRADQQVTAAEQRALNAERQASYAIAAVDRVHSHLREVQSEFDQRLRAEQERTDSAMHSAWRDTEARREEQRRIVGDAQQRFSSPRTDDLPYRHSSVDFSGPRANARLHPRQLSDDFDIAAERRAVSAQDDHLYDGSVGANPDHRRFYSTPVPDQFPIRTRVSMGVAPYEPSSHGATWPSSSPHGSSLPVARSASASGRTSLLRVRLPTSRSASPEPDEYGWRLARLAEPELFSPPPRPRSKVGYAVLNQVHPSRHGRSRSRRSPTSFSRSRSHSRSHSHSLSRSRSDSISKSRDQWRHPRSSRSHSRTHSRSVKRTRARRHNDSRSSRSRSPSDRSSRSYSRSRSRSRSPRSNCARHHSRSRSSCYRTARSSSPSARSSLS